MSEPEVTTIRTTGTVVIDVEACKGCDLCIDACPKDVLVMTTNEVNTRGYRYPQLLPGCIACKAGTQICPDFVFQVYRYAEPVDLTVTPDGVVSEVIR
ncbi:MAG: 4Fe-4S dicluster domain-containing protein [Mycobacterium sp.]|nr:4Fe-4S dicluster domain-containing protein [Mycobacterium sp.]